MSPSPVFPGLRELTQKEAQGEGEPQLVGMHLGRQRRAILNHLCQVCGQPTDRGDRFLFPAVTGTFIKVKGRSHYATHMPPVHGACAERAMRMCPHLRGQAAKPTSFPHDEGFLSPQTDVPDTLADRLPALPPLGAVFSYVRVFGAGFTRIVERARGGRVGTP